MNETTMFTPVLHFTLLVTGVLVIISLTLQYVQLYLSRQQWVMSVGNCLDVSAIGRGVATS